MMDHDQRNAKVHQKLIFTELGPGHSDLLPSSDDILQGSCSPEVLLLEAEFLACPEATQAIVIFALNASAQILSLTCHWDTRLE